MPEQLSQAQIDALLSKMSAGEVEVEEEKDTRKIKEYDFASPKKFTKEQLKALDGMHETFARLLASYLSGLLRSVVDVKVVQIEELRYFEYNNALPDTGLVGILDFLPEDSRYSGSNIIMDVSTTLGFYLIDRLLGGSGKTYNLNRDYTDIEIALLSNVLTKISERMQDAWSSNLAVGISLDSIETNSRLLQVFAPDDIVVISALDISIGSMTGNLSVCLSAESLEEFIDTFAVRFTRSSKRADPEREQSKRQTILENVFESDMEVRIVFDEFSMELRDVLGLQPEDIIPLNKGINGDVLLRVDNIPWFSAKLGETKGKKSVKLSAPLN